MHALPLNASAASRERGGASLEVTHVQASSKSEAAPLLWCCQLPRAGQQHANHEMHHKDEGAWPKKLAIPSCSRRSRQASEQ